MRLFEGCKFKMMENRAKLLHMLLRSIEHTLCIVVVDIDLVNRKIKTAKCKEFIADLGSCKHAIAIVGWLIVEVRSHIRQKNRVTGKNQHWRPLIQQNHITLHRVLNIHRFCKTKGGSTMDKLFGKKKLLTAKV